jgi:UDP-3-O-[3-hydroxymyristoyl] N-acetylglucosamine deacetylase/3-hydroxyacyl-[acyl-carrier-protein] dehydratase
LIKGGSLESALVIVDKEIEKGELENLEDLFNLDKIPEEGENGYLNNTPLRFKNEPARHKLLDMIGDLTLVGVPVKAQILAARPGHASNYEFSKKLRELYLKKREKQEKEKNKKFEQNINRILDILPHRYPFLLVDRMVEFDLETSTIKGYKNVTINEPFFNGHFPGKPIMPGVLILESMAQVGGMLIFNYLPQNATDNKIALFSGIKNAKFRKPVVPGDRLDIAVKLESKRLNVFMFHAIASVDGSTVAEAHFNAALVDK